MTRIIFKSSLSNEMRDNILARLKQIEIDNNVRIILRLKAGAAHGAFHRPTAIMMRVLFMLINRIGIFRSPPGAM